jgi:hypothetical protein
MLLRQTYQVLFRFVSIIIFVSWVFKTMLIFMFLPLVVVQCKHGFPYLLSLPLSPQAVMLLLPCVSVPFIFSVIGNGFCWMATLSRNNLYHAIEEANAFLAAKINKNAISFIYWYYNNYYYLILLFYSNFI